VSCEEVFAARLRLAAEHPRDDVNRLVAEAFGKPRPDIIEAGRRAFYERDVGPLTLDPEVAGLLTRLQARHRLFLVTVGGIATQQAKVQALGLEPWFESIHYLDHRGSRSKQDLFEELAREQRLEPSRCVVVGDRPDAEIRAGNRLGMWTVRLLVGEHRTSRPRERIERADFDIERLAGLEEAVSRIEASLRAGHGKGQERRRRD
jgi:FMN phosphatase YigB (HAD superfamily)